MNWLHQRYCVSEKWRDEMVGETLPWVLEDMELDGPVLEVGSGPGLVTEALVQFGVADLTTLTVMTHGIDSVSRWVDGMRRRAHE